jgi:NAD/NADP transhydrogenase alpha subunit
MLIGIPKESFPGERRVAMTPPVVSKLIEVGQEVLIESQAGARAGHSDEDFKQKGARIISSREELFASADVILQLLALSANPPGGLADLELMPPGQVLISFLRPVKQEVESLGARFVELPLETDDSKDAGTYAKAKDESVYQCYRRWISCLRPHRCWASFWSSRLEVRTCRLSSLC